MLFQVDIEGKLADKGKQLQVFLIFPFDISEGLAAVLKLCPDIVF